MSAEDDIDITAQILTYGYCDCTHKGIAQAPHTCPFAEEIHNDSQTLCNCCEFCMQSCADDI